MHFLIYMLHLRITMLTVEISDHQCKFHCQTLRFCLCSTELSLRPVDEAPEAGVTAPLHSPSSPLLLGEVRELKTERSLSPPHTGQRMWSEVNAVEPKKKNPSLYQICTHQTHDYTEGHSLLKIEPGLRVHILSNPRRLVITGQLLLLMVSGRGGDRLWT